MPQRLRDAPDTYIFSLSQIREKLDDRWAQYGPSVHRIARRMLSANLADKGSFQQFGDAYVITFKRLRGHHAIAAGRKLYQQFMMLLFEGKGGDDPERASRPSPQAPPHVERRPGPIRRLLRRLGSWLSARFRRGGDARPAEDAEEAEDKLPDTQVQAISAEAAAADTRHPASTRPPSRRYAARLSRARPADIGGTKAPSAMLHQARQPQDAVKLLREARALEDALASEVLRRSGVQGAADQVFPPPDLNFLYRSMWNLKSQYLTTYTSVPICWKSSMEISRGEDVVPLPRRPEDLFELDLRNLEHWVEIVDRFIKRKQPVLFMAGVHATTLANGKFLQEYLAVAQLLPAAARQSLIFEIIDIGDYAHQLEAIRMVKSLSPYARAVTASLGLDDRNFAFWKRCGLMGVGVDLSRDTRVEAEIIARLGNFAAQTRRNRLISYLRELDTRSLAIAALSFGFDFLEGPLIGSSDDPDTLVLSEFTLESLYIPEVVWAQ